MAKPPHIPPLGKHLVELGAHLRRAGIIADSEHYWHRASGSAVQDALDSISE